MREELEFFQLLLWAGRLYLVILFVYGIYLLARQKLWLLQSVFIVGATSYVSWMLLINLHDAPKATPYRVLAVYGIAICVHVLLLVIHILSKRQSLARLKPFSSSG